MATMTCPRCGKKMPAGGTCPSCGYKAGKGGDGKKPPFPPKKKGPGGGKKPNPFSKKTY